MKGWFCIDFLSGIPYDLLTFGVLSRVKGLKMLKGFRFFKFAKLLRFLKISKLIKNRDVLDFVEDLQSDLRTRSTMRIIKIIVLTGFACHYMSCIWGLVGIYQARAMQEADFDDWGIIDPAMMGGDDDRLTESWFFKDGFYLMSYVDNSGVDTFRIPPDKLGSVYLSSFYLCFTTITSVGYGDIHPTNDKERIVCVFIEAGGGLVYAMIIASVTSIVTSMDANTRLVQEELDAISSWCRISNMSHKLGKRVRRYFRHYYSSRPAIDQGAILTQLSKTLRSEVAEFLLSSLLDNIDIFTKDDSNPDGNSDLWAAILPRLRPAKFEAGESLCEQGDLSADLIIIIEGKVKCTSKLETDEINHLAKFPGQEVPPSGKITRFVNGGECLNDLNLLQIWEYCVEGAKAVIPTDAYLLTNKDLAEIFDILKDQSKIDEMHYYAKSRYDTIQSDLNSWGRPLRVRSDERINQWRKSHPDPGAASREAASRKREMLRRGSVNSMTPEDSAKLAKKNKKKKKKGSATAP